MNPIIVTQTGVGSSRVIPINVLQPGNTLGLGIFVVGTASFAIETTSSDITADGYNPSTDQWSPGANGTTSQATITTGAWRGIRLTVLSGTGTVTFKLVQANLSNNFKQSVK